MKALKAVIRKNPVLCYGVIAAAIKISLAASLLFCAPANAAENPDTPVLSDTVVRTRMNGYALSDFGDFTKTWHFVTTRFRNDTKHMRFIYANDVAWKTLQANTPDYPDGSIFGKIAFMTSGDDAFPDSYVPTEQVVYQFMVKDKKRFADTGGWGYVITTPSGLVVGGDDKERSEACQACHALVPERGFVFSRPISLGPAAGPSFLNKTNAAATTPPWFERLPFRTEDKGKLPPRLARQIPAAYDKVELLGGEIEKHNFPGMMDEIRLLLAAEAARSKMPAALIGEKGRTFSLVFPDPGQSCLFNQTRNVKGVPIKAFYTAPVSALQPDGTLATSGLHDELPIIPMSFCEQDPGKDDQKKN
jgi:hypothetical protein